MFSRDATEHAQKAQCYIEGFKKALSFTQSDVEVFAEWIELKSPYVLVKAGDKYGWVNTDEQEVYVHASHERDLNLIENFSITTQELYKLFKQSKQNG